MKDRTKKMYLQGGRGVDSQNLQQLRGDAGVSGKVWRLGRELLCGGRRGEFSQKTCSDSDSRLLQRQGLQHKTGEVEGRKRLLPLMLGRVNQNVAGSLYRRRRKLFTLNCRNFQTGFSIPILARFRGNRTGFKGLFGHSTTSRRNFPSTSSSKSKASFDYYLQEALKELEKPCEEFDPEKCDGLLTRCCRVLLEDVNENSNCTCNKEKCDTKDEESQSCNQTLKPFIGRYVPAFQENHKLFRGKDYEESTICGSTSCESTFSLSRNSSFRSGCRLFTAGSSVLSGGRPSLSSIADRSSSLGRFHSDPPKGELNEKQGKAKENQQLFTVAVEIDSLSGETLKVKADSPEKALAEALSKLTPGVKTSVWGEE